MRRVSPLMIGSSRVPDLRTESGGAAGIIVRRFGIPVISHFYNVINELRERVSTLEKKLKPLVKDDWTN